MNLLGIWIGKEYVTVFNLQSRGGRYFQFPIPNIEIDSSGMTNVPSSRADISLPEEVWRNVNIRDILPDHIYVFGPNPDREAVVVFFDKFPDKSWKILPPDTADFLSFEQQLAHVRAIFDQLKTQN